jgi:hypothetical protein
LSSDGAPIAESCLYEGLHSGESDIERSIIPDLPEPVTFVRHALDYRPIWKLNLMQRQRQKGIALVAKNFDDSAPIAAET